MSGASEPDVEAEAAAHEAEGKPKKRAGREIAKRLSPYHPDTKLTLTDRRKHIAMLDALGYTPTQIVKLGLATHTQTISGLKAHPTYREYRDGLLPADTTPEGIVRQEIASVMNAARLAREKAVELLEGVEIVDGISLPLPSIQVAAAKELLASADRWIGAISKTKEAGAAAGAAAIVQVHLNIDKTGEVTPAPALPETIEIAVIEEEDITDG